MPIPFLGELAALGTSIAFSFGPMFFTMAGREVGSVIVNRSRLVAALGILSITHFFFYGTLLPVAAGGERWFWFALSGVIGLTLGDAGLFQAFIMLGPRLTMLIFAISPVISAVLGRLFLAESLSALQMLGMAVTLAGVTWVVAERGGENKTELTPKEYSLGILFALIGAAGQAVGLFTAKIGLEGDYPAISGQIIRMLAAAAAIWLWTFAKGKAKETVETLAKHPVAVRNILIASLIGPSIGVWFSLVSVQATSLGVASTLQSLPPVFLIPIGYYFFKEKITARAVIGTLVALAGVAILFMV